MTDLRLAEGEEVVRQYGCTAVDRCAAFAGTVLPLGSKKRVESTGTLTVTSRRVVYDMDVHGRRGMGTVHRETRIDDVSSLSVCAGMFGRNATVPALLVIVGFILIFAPYVYAYETDAFATEGDYRDGYNAGVELGYYVTYLEAIAEGEVPNTIPPGYSVDEVRYPSEEFLDGYYDGALAGLQRAMSDVTSGVAFTVPTDLMISGSASTWVLVSAVVGAVVFVLGAVFHVLSYRTRGWVRIGVGSGSGRGVYITSLSLPEGRDGVRPLTPGEGASAMAEELGAAILEAKARNRASTGGCRWPASRPRSP